MSLMELIIRVIKTKKRDLIVLLVNSFLLILFYLLLFENSEIIYPLMLSGSVVLVYFIIETIKYNNFIQKLEDSKGSPNYDIKVDYNEEDTFNTIREIHSYYLDKIYTLNQNNKDRDTLFSQWIHNMKTSITVIDLACEKSISKGENNKCIDDIKEENDALKKNLEECLNVLRLDDFSRDYITDPHNLKMLINDVINSKKRDFIYKGVFPKVDIDTNIYVYTDKKWCEYMLEQIISNAIKYSKGGSDSSINISANVINHKIELKIVDKGMGISKEDLPRIFDPFFTGSNGRSERGATGIGLYMVRLISKKLGHVVEIESDIDVGTEVKVIFKN